jgi:hypothetical protein
LNSICSPRCDQLWEIAAHGDFCVVNSDQADTYKVIYADAGKAIPSVVSSKYTEVVTRYSTGLFAFGVPALLPNREAILRLFAQTEADPRVSPLEDTKRHKSQIPQGTDRLLRCTDLFGGYQKVKFQIYFKSILPSKEIDSGRILWHCIEKKHGRNERDRFGKVGGPNPSPPNSNCCMQGEVALVQE